MIKIFFEYFFAVLGVTLGLGWGLMVCVFCYVTLNHYAQKLLNYLEKIQEARNANH